MGGVPSVHPMLSADKLTEELKDWGHAGLPAPTFTELTTPAKQSLQMEPTHPAAIFQQARPLTGPRTSSTNLLLGGATPQSLGPDNNQQQANSPQPKTPQAAFGSQTHKASSALHERGSQWDSRSDLSKPWDHKLSTQAFSSPSGYQGLGQGVSPVAGAGVSTLIGIDASTENSEEQPSDRRKTTTRVFAKKRRLERPMSRLGPGPQMAKETDVATIQAPASQLRKGPAAFMESQAYPKTKAAQMVYDSFVKKVSSTCFAPSAYIACHVFHSSTRQKNFKD